MKFFFCNDLLINNLGKLEKAKPYFEYCIQVFDKYSAIRKSQLAIFYCDINESEKYYNLTKKIENQLKSDIITLQQQIDEQKDLINKYQFNVNKKNSQEELKYLNRLLKDYKKKF